MGQFQSNCSRPPLSTSLVSSPCDSDSGGRGRARRAACWVSPDGANGTSEIGALVEKESQQEGKQVGGVRRRIGIKDWRIRCYALDAGLTVAKAPSLGSRSQR